MASNMQINFLNIGEMLDISSINISIDLQSENGRLKGSIENFKVLIRMISYSGDAELTELVSKMSTKEVTPTKEVQEGLRNESSAI